MNRRDFITLLGSTAAWPVAARGQQATRMRRVAALVGWSPNVGAASSDFAAFVERLSGLGWTEGRNLHIEQRWTDSKTEKNAALAKELVALQPDVIVGVTTAVAVALFQETKQIPIVFVVVSDPVAAGVVASLARPGGNITGFGNVEGAMGGKWLDLLKQVVPSIKRAAIMFNPDTAPGGGSYFLVSFEAAARSLMMESVVLRVRSAAEIEQAIDGLDGTETGLVLPADPFVGRNQTAIIARTLRYKIPTIHDNIAYAREGGLLSYGPNFPDLFRRGAGYVDRILRGDKPADLPVQLPTVNLKTAKVLGLTVPPSVLVSATEQIE